MFCIATGTKVNIDKSEVLCIGKAINSALSFNIPVSINKDCVQILGIYLGPNKELCERLNWKSKLDKLQTLINLWSQRKLTLNGKATVWNTLLSSRLWYIVSTINVPKWVEKDIQTLFCKFMWDGKIPLIKYSTIIGNRLSGGLNIQDFSFKKVAFRIKMIKKYFDHEFKAVWKYTMSEFLGKYMNMNLSYDLFNIVYDKSALAVINPFYAEVLSAWDFVTNGERHFSLDLNKILSQPLFHNPHIKHKDKLLLFSSFIESGIVTVADIAYEVIPGFFPVSGVVEIIQEKCPDLSEAQISLAYSVFLNTLPE